MEGKAVPEGYHSVNVYLCVDGAARALDFYKAAFGATETMRIDQPDGRIGHAEIRIGDSTVMLSDEFPEMGATGPKSLGGSPVMIHVYVADAGNSRIQRFSSAGAFLSKFGSVGTGNGQFNHPDSVEVDSEGNVWVGDQSNHRVQAFQIPLAQQPAQHARAAVDQYTGIAAVAEQQIARTGPARGGIGTVVAEYRQHHGARPLL